MGCLSKTTHILRTINRELNMNKDQELSWADVRKQVLALNPELCKIIDEINPSKEYTFFKISYPYGAEILQHAELNLPNGANGVIPLKNSQVDANLKEKLGYNFGSNPVAILLKNSVELFVTLDDRIIPYGVINPGKVFGTWRILDNGISHCPPTFLWGMTAGVRSLFMLPKISEASSHGQLRKNYQLTVEKPRTLLEHGDIFRELASHENFNNKWNAEILFFTRKWFDRLNDSAWVKFKCYLLDQAWQGSGYWRNQYIWRLIFSLIHKNRNIKTSAYLADIVQHVLSIAVGAVPGFRPATDDSLAPISRLQEIYLNDYNLKSYAPIIMQPGNFSLYGDNRPVYYSLQYPTAIEFSPKSSDRNSVITDLFGVNSLLKKYLAEIATEKLNISATPLNDLPSLAKITFFHNNVGHYQDVEESSQIPIEDSAFNLAAGKDKSRAFPKNSTFFNGCIRISMQDIQK